MKDVYEMNRDEFRAALDAVTAPEDIYAKAARGAGFYDVLTELFGQGCLDSVLREWAFEWSTDRLGIPYGDIYDRWLG